MQQRILSTLLFTLIFITAFAITFVDAAAVQFERVEQIEKMPRFTTLAGALNAVNTVVNEGGYEYRSPANFRQIFAGLEIVRRNTQPQLTANLKQLDLAESLLWYGCVTTPSWKGHDRAVVKSFQRECFTNWHGLIVRCLRASPDDIDIVRAAISYYGLIGDKSARAAWQARLQQLDPNSLESIQRVVASALANGNGLAAVAGMVGYCSSPRVDLMLLRGTLEWFVAEGMHAGLDLMSLKPLIEIFPSGEELEWYVNVGSKLKKEDPRISDRIQEVNRARTSLLVLLRSFP